MTDENAPPEIAQSYIDFFSYTPDEVTRTGADLSIPKKKKSMYKVNGLAVSLDENWKYNEGFGHPGYWLNIHGRKRDAQIMIEKEDVSILKGSDNLTDLPRSSLASCPSANYLSVEFRQIDGNVELSYFLYDESGYKNYQYCFICTKGNDLYIINFSAFADIFEANKAYFDKITAYILKKNKLKD